MKRGVTELVGDLESSQHIGKVSKTRAEEARGTQDLKLQDSRRRSPEGGCREQLQEVEARVWSFPEYNTLKERVTYCFLRDGA